MAYRPRQNDGPDMRENMDRFMKLTLMGFRVGPKRYRRMMMAQMIFMAGCLVVWIKFNGGLLPWFLRQEEQPAIISPDISLLNHFLISEKDGSYVTWAHGLNSKESLLKAVNSDAMMLEGDIVLKGQDTDHQELVAVMARAPHVPSDITLAEWLNATVRSKKGLMLDFKSDESVGIALTKLKDMEKMINAPIHLSADVLPGPNADRSHTKVIDSARFLSVCANHFPKSTLSLGWTHGPIKSDKPNTYTWAMVKAMYDIVEQRQSKQPISFNVHAAFLHRSLAPMKWLVEMTDATLIIWSTSEEQVALADLHHIRRSFPRNKLFYSLHKELYSEFSLLARADQAQVIIENIGGKPSIFNAEQWKVVRSKDGEVIYLGNEAVLFQKGLLVSKNQYKTSTLSISGQIELFGSSNSPAEITEGEQGVDVFVLVTQSSRPDTISGIKCFMGIDGTLEISTQGMPGIDRHATGSLSSLSLHTCYNFKVHVKYGNRLFLTVSTTEQCGSEKTFQKSETELEMSLEGMPQDLGYLAIRSRMGKSFVAVEQFVIS